MQKKRKKLTNISFAFTHTYALKKFKKFLFSQVYIEKFKKCAKTPKKNTSWKGGGGAITAPCGQDNIYSYGSKLVVKTFKKKAAERLRLIKGSPD